MADWAFPSAAGLHDGALFDARGRRVPVRRVYCVGRNYAEHAREMGMSEAEPPFFFMKPADALGSEWAEIPYPPRCDDLHHEAELAVVLGRGGAAIPAEEAAACIWGACVAVDFTLRDVQGTLKDAGRPWEMAKGMDRGAPCSRVAPLAPGALPASGRIWLSVDGATRQDSDLDRMTWKPAQIIAELSRWRRLEAGDVILTGSPAGVGTVAPGQEVRAGVEGIGELALRVVASA